MIKWFNANLSGMTFNKMQYYNMKNLIPVVANIYDITVNYIIKNIASEQLWIGLSEIVCPYSDSNNKCIQITTM